MLTFIKFDETEMGDNSWNFWMIGVPIGWA